MINGDVILEYTIHISVEMFHQRIIYSEYICSDVFHQRGEDTKMSPMSEQTQNSWHDMIYISYFSYLRIFIYHTLCLTHISDSSKPQTPSLLTLLSMYTVYTLL